MTSSQAVRVRFAPSPTGHLHIGGIRSALFNWLFARHSSGTYLLRVEDTDVMRSTQDFVQSQLRSLQWFNLMPDEPLVFQMSRQAEHLKAAQQLLQEGKAYPCFCQPRDADTVINDLEQGLGSKYDGTCRDKSFTNDDLQKPHAIRIKIDADSKTVDFDDVILGRISVSVDQLDDFVIIRRDGTPIYNFCVVVDDIFMKISHVIRGQDHVANTPKQVVIYQALGAMLPKFAHIPLILGPSGAKLSKRDAAVSVEEYRMQGYLADALANYLVRLGWSHGDQEIFTIDEMISFFSLDNVGKKGGIFDIKKLQWMNGLYMRQKTADQLLAALDHIDQKYRSTLVNLWDHARLYALIDLYKQRSTTLIDLYNDLIKLAKDTDVYDMTLIAKWNNHNTRPMLQSFCEQLVACNQLNHDVLMNCAQKICDQYGEKLTSIAQPLRLALTGTIVSPGVFDLIAILGKQTSSQRIQALLRGL